MPKRVSTASPSSSPPAAAATAGNDGSPVSPGSGGGLPAESSPLAAAAPPPALPSSQTRQSSPSSSSLRRTHSSVILASPARVAPPLRARSGSVTTSSRAYGPPTVVIATDPDTLKNGGGSAASGGWETVGVQDNSSSGQPGDHYLFPVNISPLLSSPSSDGLEPPQLYILGEEIPEDPFGRADLARKRSLHAAKRLQGSTLRKTITSSGPSTLVSIPSLGGHSSSSLLLHPSQSMVPSMEPSARAVELPQQPPLPTKRGSIFSGLHKPSFFGRHGKTDAAVRSSPSSGRRQAGSISNDGVNSTSVTHSSSSPTVITGLPESAATTVVPRLPTSSRSTSDLMTAAFLGPTVISTPPAMREEGTSTSRRPRLVSSNSLPALAVLAGATHPSPYINTSVADSSARIPSFDQSRSHPVLPTYPSVKASLQPLIVSEARVHRRPGMQIQDWKSRVLVLTTFTAPVPASSSLITYATSSSGQSSSSAAKGGTRTEAWVHLFMADNPHQKEVGRMRLAQGATVSVLDSSLGGEQAACAAGSAGVVVLVPVERRPREHSNNIAEITQLAKEEGAVGEKPWILQFRDEPSARAWVTMARGLLFLQMAESIGLGAAAAEAQANGEPIDGDLDVAIAQLAARDRSKSSVAPPFSSTSLPTVAPCLKTEAAGSEISLVSSRTLSTAHPSFTTPTSLSSASLAPASSADTPPALRFIPQPSRKNSLPTLARVFGVKGHNGPSITSPVLMASSNPIVAHLTGSVADLAAGGSGGSISGRSRSGSTVSALSAASSNDNAFDKLESYLRREHGLAASARARLAAIAATSDQDPSASDSAARVGEPRKSLSLTNLAGHASSGGRGAGGGESGSRGNDKGSHSTHGWSVSTWEEALDGVGTLSFSSKMSKEREAVNSSSGGGGHHPFRNSYQHVHDAQPPRSGNDDRRQTTPEWTLPPASDKQNSRRSAQSGLSDGAWPASGYQGSASSCGGVNLVRSSSVASSVNTFTDSSSQYTTSTGRSRVDRLSYQLPPPVPPPSYPLPPPPSSSKQADVEASLVSLETSEQAETPSIQTLLDENSRLRAELERLRSVTPGSSSGRSSPVTSSMGGEEVGLFPASYSFGLPRSCSSPSALSHAACPDLIDSTASSAFSSTSVPTPVAVKRASRSRMSLPPPGPRLPPPTCSPPPPPAPHPPSFPPASSTSFPVGSALGSGLTTGFQPRRRSSDPPHPSDPPPIFPRSSRRPSLSLETLTESLITSPNLDQSETSSFPPACSQPKGNITARMLGPPPPKPERSAYRPSPHRSRPPPRGSGSFPPTTHGSAGAASSLDVAPGGRPATAAG